MKYLLLFVILTISSCKDGEKYQPPLRELCGINNEGSSSCNDPRLNKPDYFRAPKVGDICTNSNDYNSVYKYVSDMRIKLIKCERDLSRVGR